MPDNLCRLSEIKSRPRCYQHRGRQCANISPNNHERRNSRNHKRYRPIRALSFYHERARLAR
nr:MAG TPA: hypothetical protein [Bacteriophage sp.]DAH39262.1 MAG TPA: hypothetical protein [Caudoviricetes sp.]DAK22313.1 MAG TPA: hypothetical protein [Caudoviricetes sp.]